MRAGPARSSVVLLLAVLLAMVATAAMPDPAWAERRTARVRVRGPGAGSVERAVARVLASHGFRVVKQRNRAAALLVDGRVREKKERVAVQLTVRSKRGALVGRLRVRGASARAAARRVEDELWPAIRSSLPPPDDGGADDDGADDVDADDDGGDGEIALAAAGPVAVPPARSAAAMPERVALDRRSKRTEARPRATRVARADGGEVSRERGRGGRGDERWAGGDAQAEAELGGEAATGRRWLSIAVGPELYGRHYSYRDDIFQLLRGYDLAGTPALTAAAEIYPVASRPGALSGVGLAGRFTHVPSFESEDAAGSQYTSDARSYTVGGRYRVHIARVELAGALDYGAQSFSIAPLADAPDPDFPDAGYRFLRAGLAARAPLWSRFAIAGSAGYRQVLASGEIESDEFFPRSSARGLDLELELSADLLFGFDVRAGAALERYGHALDPEPGDARVAGGALDQYPRFYIRLGYTR